ncbi:MAG TPA: hypothetical protein VF891_05610 [Gaiellaceae bacterium]
MSAPFSAAFLLLAAVALVGCGDGESGREVAKESLESELDAAVPHWIQREHCPPAAVPGAHVFARSGCAACHTYLGSGSSNLGARDLSAVGRRHDEEFFERYVADPSLFGDDVMPKFRALGKTRLHQLAVFLSASKGER